MSSRINIAALVVFTAFAIIGATIALSTTGFFDTTGILSVYAQNDTMMSGDNMTGGNMTGGMSNMTG
ncbi:MAG TPA: hypothetical protein VE544_11920 [Nitrososphaeraceae archaeon]|nr:hypothetical protein [Nitrososphaeraceae archaeon]